MGGRTTDLAQTYPLEWFERRAKSKRGPHRSSVLLANVVWRHYRPKTVCDLGAGTFAFANRLAQLGAKVLGVEGSAFCRPFAIQARFLAHDLRKPFPRVYPERFALVTSWDVIEHLPESAEPVILRTIAALTQRVAMISVDAGPPPWGRGHVNCKSKGYWRERFAAVGLDYDADATQAMRAAILAVPGITSRWYAHNLLVLVRAGGKGA